MVIRKAAMADIEQLAELLDMYRVWYNKQTDIEGARSFLTARMTQNESEIFVAEEEGVLAGFTQLYPQFSSVRMKRSWLLNDLFVRPEYRGRGISKQLLDAAKGLARSENAAGVLLETDKTNEIGNRLYPATGFKLYDHANFYWWEE